MKRLYVLAAAVSVTGGMAFAAPKENAPEKEEAVLDVQTPPGKQDRQGQPGHSGTPAGRLPHE